jgi:hypothetical protein
MPVTYESGRGLICHGDDSCFHHLPTDTRWVHSGTIKDIWLHLMWLPSRVIFWSVFTTCGAVSIGCHHSLGVGSMGYRSQRLHGHEGWHVCHQIKQYDESGHNLVGTFQIRIPLIYTPHYQQS